MTAETESLKDQYIRVCELASQFKDVISDLKEFSLVNPEFFASVSHCADFCNSHFDIEEKKVYVIGNKIGEWISGHKVFLQLYKFFNISEEFNFFNSIKTDPNIGDTCFTSLLEELNTTINKSRESGKDFSIDSIGMSNFLSSFCEYKQLIEKSDYKKDNQTISYLMRMDNFFNAYAKYTEAVLLDHKIEKLAMNIYMKILKRFSN